MILDDIGIGQEYPQPTAGVAHLATGRGRMEVVMRRLAVALAVSALLALSMFSATGVAASSSALTITADRASAIPSGHDWSYNDFFPRTISVHQGATVRFVLQGFHTATLLPAGVSATSARRSTGLLKADDDDTTLNPNGSTHVEENIGSLFPVPGGCGSAANPCRFDGASPVSTGAPLSGPVPALNVKVTAPVGFYRYLCLIHPNMQGWLAVVPASFHATTPAELTARVHSQVAHDRAAGFAAEAAANVARSHLNSNGTRTWIMTAGTSSPNGYVAVNEMLPRKLSIHRGDQVTWVSRALNEPHTVTFPTDLHTDMAALCESGAVDVPATPTVFPPTGPQDFTCSGAPPDEFEMDGGNGVSHVTSKATVADSGIIASSAELSGFGLPVTAAKARTTVSFAGASRTTYHYVCQIHDGMEGAIVVR
jgi:plastocyanin